MKSVEAVWELEDLGSVRTRVSYRLDVDPGGVLGLDHPRAGGGGDAGDLRQWTPRRTQAACRGRLSALPRRPIFRG